MCNLISAGTDFKTMFDKVLGVLEVKFSLKFKKWKYPFLYKYKV